MTDTRRRADAGTVRVTDRDVRGMSWVVEMYGMPFDLLRRVLATSDSAARNVVSRWRRAGWVETGSRGAGPMWVWATEAGIREFGRHPYAPNVPSAARVAHLRAAIVVRLYCEQSPAYQDRRLDWRSEREIRWEMGQRIGSSAAREHVPDAEAEVDTPAGGRTRIAIEVEITPKDLARTLAIMRLLVDQRGYLAVTYFAPSHVRPLLERCLPELNETSARRITITPYEKAEEALS